MQQNNLQTGINDLKQEALPNSTEIAAGVIDDLLIGVLASAIWEALKYAGEKLASLKGDILSGAENS
jgi:hypothetical protein